MRKGIAAARETGALISCGADHSNAEESHDEGGGDEGRWRAGGGDQIYGHLRHFEAGGSGAGHRDAAGNESAGGRYVDFERGVNLFACMRMCVREQLGMH